MNEMTGTRDQSNAEIDAPQSQLGNKHQLRVYVRRPTPWVKKTGPVRRSGKASSKSTDVGNLWPRQSIAVPQFICKTATTSNQFNAVENHLQFPWQR